MKTLLIAASALAPFAFARLRPAPADNGQCVILLHGLGRSSLSMKRIEWALRGAGCRVINVPYPSRRMDVPALASTWLAPAVLQAEGGRPAKIHFVTHSMGGILLRQYLTQNAITNLGRVVMLAPPNHGSELSDFLQRCAVGRWILGPAGRQLGTRPTDLPQRLGPVRFDLGVIVGDASLNPISSRIAARPNDGKVSVASAKIEGMRDFLVIHGSHTWIMWRAETLRQTLAYLRTGRFVRPASSPSRAPARAALAQSL